MRYIIAIIGALSGICLGYGVIWLLHLFMYKEYMQPSNLNIVAYIFLVTISLSICVAFLIAIPLEEKD